MDNDGGSSPPRHPLGGEKKCAQDRGSSKIVYLSFNQIRLSIFEHPLSCAQQVDVQFVIPPSREPSVKPWACSLSNFCSRLVVCQFLVHLLRLVRMYTAKGGPIAGLPRSPAAFPAVTVDICMHTMEKQQRADAKKAVKTQLTAHRSDTCRVACYPIRSMT